MSTIWTKGALVACLCILTAGGLTLIAKSDYTRLTSSISQNPAQEHSNKKSPSNLNSPSSLSQAAKLFGQVAEKPQEISPEQLPETRLNLLLKGTFTHEDSDKASALIAENNKNTARFFVGDEIPGGAELIAVRKGEITLRRNGQDELLKLPYLKENSPNRDERVARNKQRQALSVSKTNSLAKNSQVITNPKANQKNTNNSHQQQLKDRLARLRSNNANK